MKGTIHVDFIVAIAIFIIFFISMFFFITSYFASIKDMSDISNLRSEALFVQDIISKPSPIQLETDAYRFLLVINNTQPFLRNQSLSVTTLTNEYISFNYADIGFSTDVNSTVIYDDLNNPVPYEIESNGNITIVINIAANETRNYTIYFDDDSNFTSRSVPVAGNDNLTETLYPVEKFRLLQYRKITDLNKTPYTNVKNISSLNFHITLQNRTEGEFLDYGGNVPRVGDIVSLEKFYLYQNETADIVEGKLIITVW